MNEKAVDSKIFMYMAYAPFLWIIGFLSPYKNEREIKFHVGQGMILNIIGLVVFLIAYLLNTFIIKNLFCENVYVLGTDTGICAVTETGKLITLAIYAISILFYLIYIAIGLFNVSKSKHNKLPLIGEYSILR